MVSERRFYRSRDDRMISGVCAGIAEYFGVDPTWIRLIAVLLLVVGNAATAVVYIVFALVVPERPVDERTASLVPPPGPAVAPAPEVPPTPADTAVVAADVTPRHHRTGGGIAAGLVLIGVGVIMLVARFHPQFGFWNLWPLIIVFAGLAQAVTPGRRGWSIERVFDGLVTVTVGIVFLAITFGYVGWNVWWRVLTLWPVLLIAIGLGILGGAIKRDWVKALGSLVVIAALLFALVTAPGGSRTYLVAGGEGFSFTEPDQGETEGTLTLEAGVGEVALSGGDELATAEGVTSFGEPSFEVTRNGSEAAVAFSLGDPDVSIAWPGAPGSRTNMTVARDVEWDISVDSGVSTVDADLTDVEVRSFKLKTGVSDATVRVGDIAIGTDVGRIDIESGVSAVAVFVPADVEVRVEADTALVALDMGADLQSAGGRVWKTDGYDDARADGAGVWDIHVAAGVGSVRVRTY